MARRRARPMPNATGPSGLVARWRQEAAILKHRGGEPLAKALSGCADELEQWARAWELEALTLEQASTESGYSYSTLQHLVADRRLPNAGSAHRPRIRRKDLPRKAPGVTTGPQLADRVLAARGGRA